MTEQADLEDELRRARETIATQAVELNSLRAAQQDLEFAAELRTILRQAAAAVTLSEPEGEDALLEMLIQTAARVTSATAASLLVIDPEAGTLVFKAATGPKSEEIRRFVVPLGQGIAGLVAETGQPMAIADVGSDPRLYRDIGQSLGYIPSSILCVPVRRGDEILGVIELLDKAGRSSFTADDMEIVGSFVAQAAVAIEQSRELHDLETLLMTALRRLAGPSTLTPAREQTIADFVRREQAGAVHTRSIRLAETVAAIAGTGETELGLVQSWLNTFLQYLRARPSPRY